MAGHKSVSWAWPNQSTPAQPISLRSSLILSPHLHLDLQSGLTLTHLQQNSIGTPPSPIHATCPVHLILLDSIIRITHSLFLCNAMFQSFWEFTLHHWMTVADVWRQYSDPVFKGWMSKKTFGHSTLENETITLPRNVRHQLAIDAAPYLSAKG
jgi:hypothetical protein